MKRGCRHPKARGLRFGAYVGAGLAPPPASIHNGSLQVGCYGMQGNDTCGDCVEAAGVHARQDFALLAGGKFVPANGAALADYKAVADYPASGDNGTDPSDYMPAWMKGLAGAGKIAGWVEIDPANATEMMLAVQHFAGVILCAELPAQAEQKLDWFLSRCNGLPAGGHAVWINGYDSAQPDIVAYDVVTWGMYLTGLMDQPFAAFYGFGAYAAISQDWLANPPKGVNAAQLLADLSKVAAL